MGEAVGGQSLRTGRVDLFQQRLGRGTDLRLPAQQSSAPAKVLLEKIDPAGAEGLTPNSFSHRIRKSVDALRRNGITVSFRKSNGDRLVCLKRADGVDDPAAENIVTIDPDNPPCFGV